MRWCCARISCPINYPPYGTSAFKHILRDQLEVTKELLASATTVLLCSVRLTPLDLSDGASSIEAWLPHCIAVTGQRLFPR